MSETCTHVHMDQLCLVHLLCDSPGTLGTMYSMMGQAKGGEVEGQAKLHDDHHDQSQARERD